MDGERGEERDDRDEFGRREKPEAEIILPRCVNVIHFKTYIASVASGARACTGMPVCSLSQTLRVNF